jgi:hypothetical protein
MLISRFVLLIGLSSAFLPSVIAASTSAAAPTFSVATGIYPTAKTVTITDATAGAAIYYTTSGLAPTASSTPYGGPVSVGSNMTLRAIAVFPGGPASPAATAVYTITPAATPTFSLAAGTYQTAKTVTISDATAGAAIYYTTTGLAPTTASTLYKGSVSVINTMSLRAVAAVSGGPASPVATAVYTIAPAATPTFGLAAGAYTGTQAVTISDATAGATIYYTTSGLAPTTSSTPYAGFISVGSNMSLRAIAVFPGGPASAVVTAIYAITQSSSPIKTPNSSSTFFGMDINYLLKGTPWPSLSVGTIRLWNTQTLWGDLNSTRDTYNWQSLDGQINLARANNADVIYTFGGVPPWALPTNVPVTSVTRSAGVVTVTTAAPHGLYYNSTLPAVSQMTVSVSRVSDGSFNGSFSLTGTPTANIFTYAQAGANGSSSSGAFSANCSGAYAPTGCAEAPANLSDWDQYLTQLISHVGPGAIQYWELWNEPNIDAFWKGDPKMLVAMAKDAQRIIKSVDPEAIILSPGVTGNYETQVQCAGNPKYCGSKWLSNWFDVGGTSYIDAVAFHGYPVTGVAPEQIQGSVDLIQATMAQHGVGSLPVWDTESSWGQNTALAAEADQVNWLARHLLLEESMGVQRTIWYAYDNPSWGTLWKAATDINAAGEAYGQVAKWLTGTTLTGPCAALSNDATTFVCTYTRENGYVAKAIWNTAGGKSFAVSAQFVQYRDLSGAVRSTAGGTVEISTSPILLESSSVL